MSHLNAINRFKIDLIKEGVVSPYEQIEAVREAYTASMVRLLNTHKISETEHVNVMKQILGYWNEIHPVNGHKVILEVTAFFERLDSYINNIVSEAVIPLVPNKENKFNHTKLDSYKALINVLYAESLNKYREFKGV